MKRETLETRPTIDGNEMAKRAKRYGKAHGWGGNTGGWVFDERNRVIAQGWVAVYLRRWREIEGTNA